MKPAQRNVATLMLCQAFMLSSMSLIIMASQLIGFNLVTDKRLSTLPLAVLFVSTMLTSIPASLLMKRIGRQSGFIFSTLFGMGGAALAALAIIQADFWLFVIGTALIGVFNGFGNFYHFAVVDSIDQTYKSRAISFVLTGGVIAAVLGPNLSGWTRDVIGLAEFACSYAALIGLYLMTCIALFFLQLPNRCRIARQQHSRSQRSLLTIAAQPKFMTAVICGMFGYGTMTVVAAPTPLAMQHHAHSFTDTVFVVQWHMLGMFAPSFITGYLIKWIGVLEIMLIGVLLGLFSVAINISGNSLEHFWSALFLMGVSWNFLFIGATDLLTETYTTEERAKTQAVNNFIVFATVAIVSLGAGALHHTFGWQVVNLGVLPLLLISMISIVWVSYSSALAIQNDRIEKT